MKRTHHDDRRSRMKAHRRIMRRKKYSLAMKGVLTAALFLQITASNVRAYGADPGSTQGPEQKRSVVLNSDGEKRPGIDENGRKTVLVPTAGMAGSLPVYAEKWSDAVAGDFVGTDSDGGERGGRMSSSNPVNTPPVESPDSVQTPEAVPPPSDKPILPAAEVDTAKETVAVQANESPVLKKGRKKTPRSRNVSPVQTPGNAFDTDAPGVLNQSVPAQHEMRSSSSAEGEKDNWGFWGFLAGLAQIFIGVLQVIIERGKSSTKQ